MIDDIGSLTDIVIITAVEIAKLEAKDFEKVAYFHEGSNFRDGHFLFERQQQSLRR